LLEDAPTATASASELAQASSSVRLTTKRPQESRRTFAVWLAKKGAEAPSEKPLISEADCISASNNYVINYTDVNQLQGADL
jgi:hypothetical protein